MFAAALAMWLVLRGPAAKRPSWVQKTCRTAMVFFVYSGLLGTPVPCRLRVPGRIGPKAASACGLPNLRVEIFQGICFFRLHR